MTLSVQLGLVLALATALASIVGFLREGRMNVYTHARRVRF